MHRLKRSIDDLTKMGFRPFIGYGNPNSDILIVRKEASHATTDNLAVNPEFTVAFATTETMVASDFVGIISKHSIALEVPYTEGFRLLEFF